METAANRVREYVPGRPFFAVVGVVSVAAFALGIYIASRHPWEEVEGGAFWLWLVGLLGFGLLGPAILQYLLLRASGGRPRRLGFSTWRWGAPGLVRWWRSDGVLTRTRFALAYGAPALLALAVMVVYAVGFPTATPVLAFIIPAYLPNLWYALLALRGPGATLVEATDRGVRYHEPSVAV